MVDCLIASLLAAAPAQASNAVGHGGRVLTGVEQLETAGAVDVIIGAGGAANGSNFEAYHGRPTSVGNLVTGLAAQNSGSGATEYANQYAPIKSSLTGQEQTYGTVLTTLRGGMNSGSSSGFGDGGHPTGSSQRGTSGCAIVRVPADLAAGVDPTTYNDVTVRSVAKEKVKKAAKEAVKSEIKSRRKKK